MAGRFWGFGSLSFRVAVGVAVLAASVTALVLSRKPAPVAARTIEARLELAAGQVTLEDHGRAASVISGLPLPEDGRITTGKGARALVRLSDGSALFLRGDSDVTLRRTGIELKTGEVWLDAPASERGGLGHKLGKVTVSAAEAGLSMRREGDDVSVYVARGLAVVEAPGGRVEVNAGEQAKVAGDSKPAVAPVKYWEDWTGGMGDHRPLLGEASGAGRIYGIDRNAPAGTPARTLEIKKQVVRAVLRDGLAETEVDQTFGNPGGREVEGWYWFTLPERAVVTSFAVETDGTLVEGEVIERQEAAAKYQAAVRSAHEPALLEWIDGKSYRARIFPVPASGSRRVVLKYLELAGAQRGKFEYVYPLRGGAEPITIGELSLSVDLGEAGVGADLATLADAVIEDGGRRVTMRRSGYTPRADFQVEGELHASASPFRVALYSAGGDVADYVMARYVPDMDWASQKELPADLVVVVDTSASADEADRQEKTAAAEAVLRAMSPADHFALVALDTTPTVLYPKEGLAEASEKEISAALERLAEHASGGATDLGALFDVALGRVHNKEQPAVIYIGDGIATSGEITGERLAERLRRSLSTSRARFFTVAVGAEANHALLRELARAGGGQMYRIDDAEASTSEVLRLASAIKTPTITDLSIDLGAGLDEPMISATGKVSRGDEVILLARTHHPLPEQAIVKGRIGGKDFTTPYRIERDGGVGVALVPRLWATEKMRRLLGQATDPEEQRGKVVELGVDYGLVTPFTSILALESEQAYQQQGIKRRRSPLRGVHLTELTPSTERKLAEMLSPAPPVTVVGCSKSEPAGSEASEVMASESKAAAPSPPQAYAAATAAAAPESMADNDAPASPGARAKADEGKMGMRSGGGGPAKGAAANRFGVAGPGSGDDLSANAGVPVSVASGAPEPPPPPPAAAAPAGARFDAAKRAAPRPQAIEKPVEKKQLAADTAFHAKDGQAKVPPGLQKKPDDARPAVVRRPVVAEQCSDSARRPLAERIVIWRSRLKRASTAEELIQRYDAARATCEIPDWRAQAALLGLIQAKVRTEGTADALLARFAGERETQKYIAHAILRRTVDDHIVAVVRRVLFEDKVRWAEIDNDLSAIASADDRVTKLRQILLTYPDDPEAEIRLVRALAEAKQKDEALALGRRLRERGLMSPQISIALGDVLAESGFEEDSIRTYSEIVEFDPSSPDSRRLLGDVYLRHGWYPAAYRQYKTLSEASPNDPVGWLRLAAAAAGSGRVDEALRVERQVASAEGTPGPNDPRAWARLLSASRLARLLADEKMPAGEKESVSRKLKELGVLNGPAALQILTWEDYGAALSLTALDGDKETLVGEATTALPAGLSALLLSSADVERLRWVVRWKNDAPGRDVTFVLCTVIWDNKQFHVKVRPGTIGAKSKEAAP
jgi:tetratricopeptide (TPR) repeat protein